MGGLTLSDQVTLAGGNATPVVVAVAVVFVGVRLAIPHKDTQRPLTCCLNTLLCCVFVVVSSKPGRKESKAL